MRLLHTILTVAALLAARSAGLALHGKPGGLHIRAPDAGLLQNLVTWDEHSIFVRGERILFYSGEFHPFRLPVPDLWLDVFQKIKALGYSGVSFYTDWALLEGQQGVFTAEGIFDLQPFFDAASAAGIYLLARPGPYINAEVSGGGYPGWLQRIPGVLRTNESSYEHATDLYAARIGEIIAKAQITNGGPVILVQPENEYTLPYGDILFPDRGYYAYVQQQLRNAGIVVPFINNDALARGLFSPGNGTGAVDIYGHDSYPLGFDCAHPYTWPNGSLELTTNFHQLHLLESPTTPYSIVEFQGGSFDPWGGSGFQKCTTLLNEEFERVFYKSDFGAGVTIINFYMTYGGTNWGNLGHPGGYTSYDYGAVIKEDLTVTRAKYSEAKLLVNSLKVSPAYLTAAPGTPGNGSLVNTPAINVTPLYGNGTNTNFYVVRHSAYNTLDSTAYRINFSTSIGNITVPQLSDSLTLNGRDSKIHVTDYNVGDINLTYSTAEVFTWQKYDSGTVLVLYGGANETHEISLPVAVGGYVTDSSTVTSKVINNQTVLSWQVTPDRAIVSFARVNLTIYLLWRNDAYNWWALELPANAPVNNYTSPSKTSLIVSGGYLMRSAALEGSSLYFSGDVNETTSVEIIGGAPTNSSLAIFFNGVPLSFSTTRQDTPIFNISYSEPNITLPAILYQDWRGIDSLPEIQPSYDDSAWTVCNHTTSNNPLKLTTPTSLYASDYSFNAGSLIYRGHFTASSSATSPNITISTQGGYAFGYSLWVNSTFTASYPGISTAENHTGSHHLGSLAPNTDYVITVVLDHMGLDENFNPGLDSMKYPRGILSFNLSGYDQSAVTWKLTGNLGGESYVDKTRGPLNEGALFAERQGYHQPSPPSSNWTSANPSTGLTKAGVTFYSTSFNLSMPEGYDTPLSFVFANSSQLTTSPHGGPNPAAFRSMLFVNGYQFGKYVNHIGPQVEYPVPEGILNYQGENWLGITLWAMDSNGGRLDDLRIVAGRPVKSGRGVVRNSPMPGWTPRAGAY